jgi:vacuolar protein-sorting-associated protein 4
MGNKVSRETKQSIKLYNKKMDFVEGLVKDAIEAEELQEFETAQKMYIEAISSLYEFINNNVLPKRITTELMELVWDLMDKSYEQEAYAEMLNIANQPRVDAMETAIEKEESLFEGSDCEDEAVEESFQQLKKDVESMPIGAAEREQAMFKLQLAMSKKEMEGSSEESDCEEEQEIPSEKFSHVRETLVAEIEKSVAEKNKSKASSKETFKETHELMEKLKEKYHLSCDEGQLYNLIVRVTWEKEIEQRTKDLERKQLLQELREEIRNNFKQPTECSMEDGSSTSTQVKCKDGSDAGKELQELTKRIQRLVKKPSVDRKETPKLNDVVGLKAVKKLLQTGILDPIDRPYLVSRGCITPLSGMLLYGPPGTGKSMLAVALSNEARQCSFMQISKSDITSKWQGESEKLVSAVFNVAKENSPCIIFIDEVEGILEERNKRGGGSTLVQELLTNMQNLGKQGVFVLAATNNPWDIDLAFLRRFNAVVYVPLPTLHDRITILQNELWPRGTDANEALTEVSNSDLEKIALLTPNYSGGHIRNIVEAAKVVRLNRTKAATHFRKSKEFKGRMQPCGPKEPGAKRMAYKDVKDVHCPPLTMYDLEKALFVVKAQIDVEHLRKLVEWGQKNSSMATDL